MRGLKHPPVIESHAFGSHLLQMRGLKPYPLIDPVHHAVSHLLQMRGLKLIIKDKEITEKSRIFYRCVD